jgi:putative redox protein
MEWTRELEFLAHISKHAHPLVLDSSATAGGSPVDLLAASLAGCMAMDVAYTLKKGRHSFTALRTRLVARRSADVPHRMTGVAIHFAIGGSVPPAAVERAIQLSHEKYCSVWHSMRQDIELEVTFDVKP